MRLSVAIAGAMVMLAFLSACEFKSPADRVNEAVDELIEDSVEDVFGTPTPQSGGVPAPLARNAPTEASSGAAEPKIEPTGDSGPTATPQSMAKDAEGRPEAGGDGTTTSFASVSAGGDHTCRVETGGTVVCWGANEAVITSCEVAAPAPGSASADCLEDSITSSLVRFDQATPPAGYFTSVSAGALHTCGVETSDSVICWGNNDQDQATPLAGSFVSVSAGLSHTCGVETSGSVVCWGNNDHGRATPPAGTFASASAGLWHTCGVKTDGSVVCWGSNEDEESNVRGQATPPAGTFASVSAGVFHTCGVKTDGSVVCWGSNEDEEGNVVGQATPPTGSFASVSAG